MHPLPYLDDMTDEDKAELSAALAAEIRDWGAGDISLLARMITDRIGPLLHQQGWMPPGTTERVQDWAMRTRAIPDHHVSRDVLTSHLCELADILHDR
jgi:hypothetical protein